MFGSGLRCYLVAQCGCQLLEPMLRVQLAFLEPHQVITEKLTKELKELKVLFLRLQVFQTEKTRPEQVV